MKRRQHQQLTHDEKYILTIPTISISAKDETASTPTTFDISLATDKAPMVVRPELPFELLREKVTCTRPHHLTTSPPHHLTTSPPHHLTTSPPRHVAAIITFSSPSLLLCRLYSPAVPSPDSTQIKGTSSWVVKSAYIKVMCQARLLLPSLPKTSASPFRFPVYPVQQQTCHYRDIALSRRRTFSISHFRLTCTTAQPKTRHFIYRLPKLTFTLS
ncbi:hypothetical protein BJ878DRAFT_146750 [Calycina marina]|uniref:Uncharacterized protein n=1 Tax=Calycina marina TaxID=1763456 RepID=A0A9P7ZA53_9HELO|nr:hypothetical protein BJ878DRAFT_146750 [Calycina marina]